MESNSEELDTEQTLNDDEEKLSNKRQPINDNVDEVYVCPDPECSYSRPRTEKGFLSVRGHSLKAHKIFLELDDNGNIVIARGGQEKPTTPRPPSQETTEEIPDEADFLRSILKKTGAPKREAIIEICSMKGFSASRLYDALKSVGAGFNTIKPTMEIWCAYRHEPIPDKAWRELGLDQEYQEDYEYRRQGASPLYDRYGRRIQPIQQEGERQFDLGREFGRLSEKVEQVAKNPPQQNPPQDPRVDKIEEKVGKLLDADEREFRSQILGDIHELKENRKKEGVTTKEDVILQGMRGTQENIKTGIQEAVGLLRGFIAYAMRGERMPLEERPPERQPLFGNPNSFIESLVEDAILTGGSIEDLPIEWGKPEDKMRTVEKVKSRLVKEGRLK